MATLLLEKFSGIAPRTGPTQLLPNQAQVAKNVKLTSLELRPWKKPAFEYALSVLDPQTVYKLVNPADGAFVWLEWGSDVDIVSSPIADDTDARIYFTGDGAPKKTNWALATTGGTGVKPFPDATLNLGVPAPAAAPTLSASGGSAPTETRAYVYTNISTFGSVTEESAPSPAGTVTCNSTGSTVAITGFSAAPTTGYNITHRRIYRTVVGATTVSYQLVVELPVATASYNDTKAVADLGSLLQTQNWNVPPSDLQGLVAMPNGMLAGFRKNEVWFAEPYYPHAWPDLYTLTVESNIVGLGVFDTTLVVLTNTRPYLITGTSPLSVSQSKLPLPQPCVSKRSIAVDQFGVLYASQNGLVSISPGGADVATTALFTRDEWSILNPSTILGAIYNNQYVGFYVDASGIQGFVITRGDIPPLINLNFDAVGLFVEKSTTSLYAISNFDNTLYKIDSDPVNDTVYEWKSKQFVLPAPVSFGVMRIRGDYSQIDDVAAYNALVQSIITSNQAIWAAQGNNLGGVINGSPINTYVFNGSVLQPIPVFGETRFITVFVYGDGELVYESSVNNLGQIRLPANKKYTVWEILITGNIPVSSFGMATTTEELKVLME